jgi:hypothetical protein
MKVSNPMQRFVTCVALLLVLAASLAAPAESRNRRGARSWTAPVKDCTRINGRWGYYGNPWCSPAEQQRWDRAEAHRFTR